MRHLILSFLSLMFCVGISHADAQNILESPKPEPTPAIERQKAIDTHQQLRDMSLLQQYPVRNVGPVVMGGRITDIAVYPDDPSHFLVGYASGGIFETTNAGNTMDPIFDNEGSLTIGDIAISKADNRVIWAGTGENNSSRSSYAGSGVYKSEDGGQTWQFAGLSGTQHIGRIITHPKRFDVAWIASIGGLYHHNSERGVYKTTDGGDTWQKTLFINDSTGVIDLVIHPDKPDILWAAAWEREREAWNFEEGGEGSAIYKSTDGGETWRKTVEGFPQGNHVGRIGLDVSGSNPEILYAVVDNQKETKTSAKPDSDGKDELTPADFWEMNKKQFLKLGNKLLADYLKSNGFPEKYSAQRIKKDIKEDLYEPKALAEYLGDANEALFDTDVTGAQVYRSDDGGESWAKVNSYAFEVLYYTYGYYFGEIRINPKNPDELYIMGVPFLFSQDGGKTWVELAQNQDVHVDHHAMWINPQNPNHILLGNDGGLYQSWDKGENFFHHNVAPVGQFYSVAVDMETPYNIYGGLQDNGVFMGPSDGTPDDKDYWERLFGGDGMHVAVDPGNSNLVYTGFQFGNYYRIDRSSNSIERISPQHDIAEPRYRYNWNTPIAMSHHNSDILYFGSQKVNISFDRGNHWQTISPDLTNNLPNGNVPYSTLTKISESPLHFGTIWAGTDDGNIHVTRSLGKNWELVSKPLPEKRWVSDVHASHHDKATAYASLTGYRYDEFRTFIYKTENYGASWASLKANLPAENVNTIYEDPKVAGLLYLGTDQGAYVSWDDGDQWQLIPQIPNVAVYDVVVHTREMELVLGTHGRSIYVMDVQPLQELASQDKQGLTLFEVDDIRFSDQWGEQSAPFREARKPELEILYFNPDGAGSGSGQSTKSTTITMRIKSNEDANEDKDEPKELFTKKLDANRGFNRFTWDLIIDHDKPNTFLGKGTYSIIITNKNQQDTVSFEVK